MPSTQASSPTSHTPSRPTNQDSKPVSVGSNSSSALRANGYNLSSSRTQARTIRSPLSGFRCATLASTLFTPPKRTSFAVRCGTQLVSGQPITQEQCSLAEEATLRCALLFKGDYVGLVPLEVVVGVPL